MQIVMFLACPLLILSLFISLGLIFRYRKKIQSLNKQITSLERKHRALEELQKLDLEQQLVKAKALFQEQIKNLPIPKSHSTFHVIDTDEGKQAIQELTEGVANIIETIHIVSDTSKETALQAQRGRDVLNDLAKHFHSIEETTRQTSRAVLSLSEFSAEIEAIVDYIGNIAKQINLLSFSASIEASHAGEHGRGFNVLAKEMRKLSNESSQGANRISDIIRTFKTRSESLASTIEQNVASVEHGIQAVDTTKSSFLDIIDSTQELAEQIDNVSSGSELISLITEYIDDILLSLTNGIITEQEFISDQIQHLREHIQKFE